MPKYLLLAEKISKNIKQDSLNNYLENLNLIYFFSNGFSDNFKESKT
jgi:hypothetical protein